MIISCEKCNKKFELDEKLIPDTGRLLQCGSCSHEWHFILQQKTELKTQPKELEDSSPVFEEPKDTSSDDVRVKDISPSTKQEDEEIGKIDNEVKNLTIKKKIKNPQKKKKVGYFSYLLVIIISIIAIFILADTLKVYLSKFIPNIDMYIYTLKESLKDIFLFFNDLLK